MPSTRTTTAPAQREDAPTPRQMATLRSLASSRGQSFAYPKTRKQASREIKRLIAARPASRYERTRERSLAKQLPVTITDAAAVTEAEVTGYGSTALWSGTVEEAPPAPSHAGSHFDPAARRARIAKANAESNRSLRRGGRR